MSTKFLIALHSATQWLRYLKLMRAQRHHDALVVLESMNPVAKQVLRWQVARIHQLAMLKRYPEVISAFQILSRQWELKVGDNTAMYLLSFAKWHDSIANERVGTKVAHLNDIVPYLAKVNLSLVDRSCKRAFELTIHPDWNRS